ncbi:MAG TPA: carbohydrate porin [Planctomycetota bacterium]|nr:carbohydrate porin [Planctomycetota bacterium]
MAHEDPTQLRLRPRLRGRGFTALPLIALLCGRILLAQDAKDPSPKPDASPPGAQEEKKDPAPPPGLHLLPLLGDPDWSFHYQATAVEQARGSIHSPYQGPLSLQERAEHDMSYTTTIFLGRRLWEGAAVYFDPEIAGGSGLSNASGIAGFPNGEITRVNMPQPIPYLARLYLEQTIDFGGDVEKVEAGPNQLAETVSKRRLELRVGKMAVGDVFDDNAYSHDPRTQFMDWALFENGAWDYPADTRGYTVGGTVELSVDSWSVRYGIWMEPKTANGLHLDSAVATNHGQAAELEYRWALSEHPGAARLLAYANNAKMGDYRETIDDPALGMDVTRSRRNGRLKFGFGLSSQQEITKDVGVFLRAGWDDGRTESWAFTEIDRMVSPGVSVKGTLWGRPEDTFGAAFLLDGLSADHREYLARGGLGFIIGDGKLHYGFEEIVETYYAFKLLGSLTLSLDYQYVRNPAYNEDRGPANIIALRVHVDF